MNPFLNPLTLARVAKYYLTDVGRAWKSREAIERYRRKAFRRVLKYAMKVPMYREKYKGIDIDSITIDKIEKLPIITKEDIRKNFPHGIVPPNFDFKKAHMVSTSGSTGQPTSIYTDFYTIIKALMGFVREIKEYGINWRKDRMTIIADLTAGSAEEAYLNRTAVPNLKPFFKLDNMQLLHVGDDAEKMIAKINQFKPKFIGGYPGILRALAILKKKGYGEDIEPEIIASSGAVLDEYTKKYIENAFNARIYDVYGSTEAGPIAFECRRGNYHIHWDMVHVEVLDDDLMPVDYGKAGHIVVTKLYGNATPIIRYNGLNDFIIPLDEDCECGINTPLIGRIAGRKADSIIMPSGKIIPPLSFTGIPAKVMEKYNSRLISQFQIVQESYDRINIYLVMEEDENKERIKEDIKKEYEKRVEEGVEINVIEVKGIKGDKVIDSKVELK